MAFARTSADGIDEWSYGVVSGYTATEHATTLHIVCQNKPVRLPFTATTAVIQLNYALQTGGRVNTAALSPTEQLEQQHTVIAECQRRRSDLLNSVNKIRCLCPTLGKISCHRFGRLPFSSCGFNVSTSSTIKPQHAQSAPMVCMQTLKQNKFWSSAPHMRRRLHLSGPPAEHA